jgi:hypothetical protein
MLPDYAEHILNAPKENGLPRQNALGGEFIDSVSHHARVYTPCNELPVSEECAEVLSGNVDLYSAALFVYANGPRGVSIRDMSGFLEHIGAEFSASYALETLKQLGVIHLFEDTGQIIAGSDKFWLSANRHRHLVKNWISRQIEFMIDGSEYNKSIYAETLPPYLSLSWVQGYVRQSNLKNFFDAFQDCASLIMSSRRYVEANEVVSNPQFFRVLIEERTDFIVP